jgi:hypothetical protein
LSQQRCDSRTQGHIGGAAAESTIDDLLESGAFIADNNIILPGNITVIAIRQGAEPT